MGKREWSYVRWYFSTNKKKLLMLEIIMLLCMPFLAIIIPNEKSGLPISINFAFGLFGMFLILMALVLPIYNFRFIMKRESADLYFSMAIKRGKFFFIQTVLGGVCILVMPSLTFLMALLIKPEIWVFLDLIVLVMVISECIALAMYGVYSYLVIKCNNLWDAIVVCIAYSILPLLLISAMELMLARALSANFVSFSSSINEVFDALKVVQLCSGPGMIAIMILLLCSLFSQGFHEEFVNSEVYVQFFQDTQVSTFMVFYWIVVGIVFFMLAWRAYKKRKGEESEQRTTAFVCYPLLIILTTMSLLFLNGVDQGFAYVSLSGLTIVFIFYLVMNSFAQRKIQLSFRLIGTFALMCFGVVSLSLMFTITKGFGKVVELPEKSEIISVDISASYNTSKQQFQFNNEKYAKYNEREFGVMEAKDVKEAAILERMYQLQSDLIEEDRSARNQRSEGVVQLSYTMENGKQIYRSYEFNGVLIEELNEILEVSVDAEYAKEFFRSIEEHELRYPS